jgi:hypothetical protein
LKSLPYLSPIVSLAAPAVIIDFSFYLSAY